MKTIAFCLALPILASLSACKSQEQPTSPMKAEGSVAPAASGFYKEGTYKGRLYVFGTPAAYDNFEKSNTTPQLTKTYIGAGPSGESVVLEADAKTTDLQERLRGEFNRRHNLDVK